MNVKRILISQPEPANGKSPYYDIANKYNAEITFRPLFRVEEVTVREFRDQKIDILAHSAVIFMSRKAMESFFSLAQELRLTIPDDMKYFCISEQVALYLQKFVVYRKRKIFFPEGNVKSKLLDLIYKHSKEKYFIPISEDGDNSIVTSIVEQGLDITSGIMFRTVSNEIPKDDPITNYDIVLLFSPAGVASIKENYPDFEQKSIKIGAFGPKTAERIKSEGLTLNISAPTKECPSMAVALDNFLAKAK